VASCHTCTAQEHGARPSTEAVTAQAKKGGGMSDLLTQWFSGEGFLPHGHGYLWTPELLWTYLIADATIGIAYYSIPVALMYFVRKRNDVQFNWIVVMFSLFIFACGTTHFIAVWTIWHPDYWFDAIMKAVTAVVSIATAVLLWPMIPRALHVPTTLQLRKVIDQLEHEIEERKNAEEALRQSQATLRELAAYQERIREDERKRIAREIHDELGQNLLALRLDVSGLHARTGERHPHLQERTATALDYIDTTLKSIRAIMNNLRPSVLDLGLQAAIEWQVRQFERRTGVPCELILNEEGQAVPELQATAAFRILQESLNNIGRHARASHVRVELRIDDRQLTMAIKDNGVGMYPGDRRKARRFGLIGMQERITMLGGDLTIDSTPGRGTVLTVRIPIRADIGEMAAAAV
jgi:signal transduction histidine kinase